MSNISESMNPFEKLMKGFENFCVTFNNFSVATFFYLKYGLILLLFIISILTLTKYRGFFRDQKLRESKEDYNDNKSMKEKVREPHIILGIFYLALGIGILLGYLTRIMIIFLDPLPDRFIFDFINFSKVIPEENMERMKDIDKAKYPYEKSVYYIVAYFSFSGFVEIILGIRFMSLYSNKSHVTSWKLFVFGVITCVLCGFTTFMPLFL